jgi:transitional endoplasmic reticulum ATPase
MKNKQIQLKVVEAQQDDAYKGIARIDAETMKELEIRRGDAIFIQGNRKTIAIADRAYPTDIGENIIRIDGILRKNSKSGIGDIVTISKAEVKEAKKITIAPAQKGIMVQGEPTSLRNGLLGRTVIKGDIVVLGGVQKRRDLMSEEFGDLNNVFGDIFGNMGIGNLGRGISQIRFIIINVDPNQPVRITENTEVSLNPKAVELTEENLPEINYEDIGGLSEEIKKIREMVEIPLKHPEIFQKLGIEPPKGVLLHGPPGTGKTLLAKAVATETEAHFILLNGPEIMSKFYGESEKKIRNLFDDAEKNAPSIIFIDEIDAIAPKREEVQGEVERRVVSQILTMMDGLKSRGKVIVIGATNRVNSLDPALRRPGRFDREININVPNKKGRLAILKIHTRGMPLTKSVKLDEISSLTHGFVGADLESLTKEAAMNVLRKYLPKLKLDDEQIPPEVLEKLIIEKEDFNEALKTVRPSAMREVLVETPNIGWDDIGGLKKVKEELNESVEWPLKYPEAFKRIGIRAPKGILLYGPPGTGKTLLAKAVAKESESNFISVKGPSLLSKWINESHKGVKKIFDKARQVSPCIIFIDELESLASKRGGENASNQEGTKVLNQLLTEMDGLEEMNEILVLAATNRPDMLDPAILRPGRFDKIILVNNATEQGRKQIIEVHTKKMPLGTNKKLLEGKEKEKFILELAKKTEGYTGADIESIIRESGMLALRENIKSEQVTKKHFEIALKKIKPSVTKQTIEIYEKIEENFLKSTKAAIPISNSYLG